MTDAEYAEILRVHGRRVANRAVLLGTPLNMRTLPDFYDCYASEQTLPPEERCRTPLIKTFDPAGWFNLFGPQRDEWPEPDSKKDEDQIDQSLLADQIIQAARLVCLSVIEIQDEGTLRLRGNALIDEQSETIAAKFNANYDAVHDRVAEAAEQMMKEMTA